MSVFDKRRDKLKKFIKVTKKCSEEEKRNAEQQLLKPEPLREYLGPETKHKNELESRSALIVFRNQAQQKLISKLLSVRESIGGRIYITSLAILEELARKVVSGELIVKGDTVTLVPPKKKKKKKDKKKRTKRKLR